MTLKDWMEEKKLLLDPGDTDTVKFMEYVDSHSTTATKALAIEKIAVLPGILSKILQTLVPICNAVRCLPPEPWNKAIRRTGPSGSPIFRATRDFSQAGISESLASSNGLTCQWEVMVRLAIEAPRKGIPVSTAQQAIYQDFARPYQATGSLNALHKTLWTYEHAMREQPEEFDRNPVLAVLQASGTGKTRTVLQLCTEELGLYTCLDIATMTAPPADELVWDLLGRPRVRETQGDAAQTMAAWLPAFLEIFADYCEREIIDQGLTLETQNTWRSFCNIVAGKLNDSISPGYRTCYEPAKGDIGGTQVQSDSDQILFSHLPSLQRVQLLQDIHHRTNEILASEPVWREYDQVKEAKYASLMVPHIRRLQALRGGKLGITFLALDSASSLTRSGLSALRRIAYNLRGMGFWIILIDTDPGVLQLVPCPEISGSGFLDVEIDPYCRVIEPFLSMSQDVFLKTEPDRTRYLDVVEGRYRATHLEWTQMIPKMGRPLLNGGSWKYPTPGHEYHTNFNAIDLTRMSVGLVHDCLPIALVSQRIPLKMAFSNRLMIGKLVKICSHLDYETQSHCSLLWLASRGEGIRSIRYPLQLLGR